MLLGTALFASGTSLYAQKIGSVPRVPPTPGAERSVVLEWTSAEGQPYWYRLPKKIDAKSPPRLVFMLHGTGLDHGWSFWNCPIVKGSFRANDIVISPDGLTKRGETYNFVQGKKDGDQIVGLIELFRQRFPISEIRKETPSLLVVRDSVLRAQRAAKSPAAKKASREERKTAEKIVELIEEFLDEAGSSHARHGGKPRTKDTNARRRLPHPSPRCIAMRTRSSSRRRSSRGK